MLYSQTPPPRVAAEIGAQRLMDTIRHASRGAASLPFKQGTGCMPCIGLPSAAVRTLPERGSHTLTCPSCEAAATQLPDGLHAHAMPASVKNALIVLATLYPAVLQTTRSSS